MTDKKYREFYVNPERMFLQWHNGREYKFSHCHTSPFWKNEIHVIEHRALVIAEARIEKLKSDLEKAKAALNRIVGQCNVVANTATEIYASGIARQVLRELGEK